MDWGFSTAFWELHEICTETLVSDYVYGKTVCCQSRDAGGSRGLQTSGDYRWSAVQSPVISVCHRGRHWTGLTTWQWTSLLSATAWQAE